MTEYNDIYDIDRNLTGRTHRRGTRWHKGEYGLVVCVWVYDGKGNLLRAIARTARESDQAEGQIVMEGFDANDPVQTDEQAMEEELRTVREKRIEEFGLPKNPEQTVLPQHSEPPKTKTLPLPAFLTNIAEKSIILALAVLFLAAVAKYHTASAISSPVATSPIGVNLEGTLL